MSLMGIQKLHDQADIMNAINEETLRREQLANDLQHKKLNILREEALRLFTVEVEYAARIPSSPECNQTCGRDCVSSIATNYTFSFQSLELCVTQVCNCSFNYTQDIEVDGESV
jgi:hypothetical protein